MRKGLFKRMVSVLCAAVLLLSSATVAFAAQEMPSEIPVEWYAPEKLVGVEKEANRFVVKTVVNGINQEFYLSFPTFGGFRFYTENEGFFKPEAVSDIKYIDNPDGTLTITALGDTTVVFNSMRQPWAFQVFNQYGHLVAEFSAEQMWFGYQEDELKKVKLECGINDDEILYGLGERFGSFNQIGVKTLLWNRDAWSDNDTSYKNIPILHSSVGYMIYFNSTYSATADIGVTDRDKYSLDFSGPKFDFYMWTDTPLNNISAYTTLTGRALIPPKWALRYWAGASGQTWEANGVENVVGRLRETMSGYKKLGINNLAALYGEGELSYTTNAYNVLVNSSTRMLGWTNPFYSRLDMAALANQLSEKFEDNELPAFKDYYNPWSWVNTDTMDFSHPNAKEVVRGKWKKYIDFGLRGLMVDYGEYIPDYALAYNGMKGTEMHNFMAYYYTKTFNEMFTEELGSKDFILFARNAAPGSQQFATNFGGDQLGNFEGMKKAVNALLTVSTCGFSTWGTDMGGYGASESPDVYMRWMQFGTFNPLMRLHGQGERNPWYFGDVAEECFLTHYRLRENLLNKIYSSAIYANKTGRPMSQSMAVAFPDRDSLLSNNDQYIFCEDFLVCPVTESGAYYRKVSLPLGNWTDLWTGEITEGGKDYIVDAPQNYSPVFIRNGSVIPVSVSSETLNMLDEIKDDKATDALLITAPNGERKTVYYSDENTAINYTSSADKNVLTVSADTPQQTQYILAYGLNADKITVDGIKLEKLNETPKDKPGFYVDGRLRTVIKLPKSGWSEVKITVAGTLNIDLALGKNVKSENMKLGTTGPENIVDGDATTSWTLTNLEESAVIVDLGKLYQINEVVLKWCRSYADMYSIQVSVDGNNWEEIQYFEDADGMIDTIKFDAVSARYVKLCDLDAAVGKVCNLYGLSVYGNGKAGKIPDMSLTEDETGGKKETTKVVKWTVTKKKKPKKNITYEWDYTLIIALIAAAVVVVAAGTVTAVLLIKRRKKKLALAAANQNSSDISGDNPTPDISNE